MNKTELLHDIINGSVRYELHNGVLELKGLYTGKTIYIDLREVGEEALITEEEYNELNEEEYNELY